MPRVSAWLLRASLVFLLLGFTVGALLLSARGLGVMPGAWRLRPAHGEFLLFGWTVQLVMGVAVWILPRFGVRRSPRLLNATAWTAFALLNPGVLLAGLSPFVLAGRFLEVGAAVAFATHVWARLTRSGLSEM